MRSLLLFAAASLLLGDALAQTPETTTPSPPDAASILREMEQTYALAKTYAGESTATYRHPDGKEQLTVSFRIWFARPTDFRIDADSKRVGAERGRREVLWSNGSATRTWATGKPVATLSKVQIAGSGMFGTYAYHVPTLLDASYGGRRRLHELTEPELVGEEEFEGIACHRVKGKWEGDTYEVWLGKDDHLVRKILATYSDHVLEEIHHEIELDQPIPKDTFRFAPEEEVAPKKP